MCWKCGTISVMLKDRDYDVTPHIILILSLICAPNQYRVGEGVRGVVWRWSVESAGWPLRVEFNVAEIGWCKVGDPF